MKFINSLFFNCFAILLIISTTTCAFRDNPNDYLNPDFKVTATISPSTGSTIAGHETIVIRFDATMNRSTLSISGGASGIDSSLALLTWSTTAYTDDTVTISINTAAPKTFWPKGNGKTITVTCSSSEGQSASVSAAYNVVYKVYVNNTTGGAAPTYTGTSALPLNTIQAGITRANDLINGTAYSAETSEVCVAAGTYSENSIGVINRISVKGGYSSTNWNAVRNVATYVTTISDARTSGGSTGSPNAVFTCPNTITDTANTVIDGFTINLGGGACNAGIFCQGSPTISHNTIAGKTSTTTGITEAYGISIIATASLTAAPIISYNTIEPGYGNESSDYTYGIYSSGNNSTYQANAQIDHNTINGGHGLNTYGIYMKTYSNPTILNNTKINCGAGTLAHAYCIYIAGNCNPDIEVNSLTNDSTLNSMYGIYEQFATSNSAKVRNNYFNFSVSGSQVFYHDDGATDIKDLGAADDSGTHKVTTKDDGTHDLKYSVWGNY